MFDKILQRGYWVAGWIVCLLALCGFYLSIRSSNEMSKTLEKVATAVTVSTTPLIKFRGYQWIYSIDTNKISCDHPPIGVLARFGNLSSVPLQIHDSIFKAFYGDMELKEYIRTIGSAKKSSSILAPSEEIQSGITQEESFKKYLRGKRDIFEPPFIKVQLDIKYSRLNDPQCFYYHAVYEIGFSCLQTDLYRSSVLEETNSPARCE